VVFDRVLGMFSQDIAIDLGTANTLVHMRGRGIVLDEPSVVAITKGSNKKVVAVGHEAKEMLGKTPGNIEAIRPMREGVIADFAVTEAMLKYFIRRVHRRNHLIRSRLVISIPAGITDVETKAVREAALGAGVRQVLLIEQPMAAAVGAGLPVLDARGSMIIDIGGGTTDIAVISLGGLVTYRTLKVAGDRMDDAIIQYVRRRSNILIGERTAEGIKMRIGKVHPSAVTSEMEIKGRDLISGVPRSIKFTGDDVMEALGDVVHVIVEAARSVLERTPPELSADLAERGIVLVGGGAQIAGLDKVLREETGIPVIVAEDPLLAVVNGVGMVLEDLERYRGLLF
jgi:rod shape-determining protein MreB